MGSRHARKNAVRARKASTRAARQARRDSDITRQLDALFAEPVLARQQARDAERFGAAGTDWTDERW